LMRRMHHPSWRRPGMTLIEVLVVIAIIGVLTALVSAAVMRAGSGQTQRNAQNLVRLCDSELAKHWQKVFDDAVSPNSKTSPTIPANTLAIAGNPAGGS